MELPLCRISNRKTSMGSEKDNGMIEYNERNIMLHITYGFVGQLVYFWAFIIASKLCLKVNSTNQGASLCSQ